MRQLLQGAVNTNELDFFQFLVGEPTVDLDGAPYGGARFHITARLAGRTFADFHVDVGPGDIILLPTQSTVARDWLGFADIPAPTCRVISKEQQFAEKIHAYSLPREQQNSRVKDLVDLFLLVDSAELKAQRVREAVEATFRWRDTHGIPARLEEPPDDWKSKFTAYMKECGRNHNMTEAHMRVNEFYMGIRNERPQ